MRDGVWVDSEVMIRAAMVWVCAAWLAAVSSLAGAMEETPPAPAPGVLESGWVSLRQEGDRVVSLRFDGTGQGRYGMETVPAGEGIGPVARVELKDDRLDLVPVGGVLRWTLPIMRTGYYDSDAHVHYPETKSTSGATPLTLPFRSFVGASGQVVRMEHFQNLDQGDVFLWLNLGDEQRLLFQSDTTQNWDLDTEWPGCGRLDYATEPDRVVFGTSVTPDGVGGLTGPVRIEVVARGSRDVPGGRFALPQARLEPDFEVTYAPTGKRISASRLLTELMHQGIYWAPVICLRGEWVLGTVETHLYDDPRSWYAKRLRRGLLEYLGFMGYDRFGHFGHIYQWGRFPDYGAGGWLNKPPENAPVDMRMLQNNGIWVHSLAQYALATRDEAFLRARRCRWVATDGAEGQPICGGQADWMDHVLTPGDVRLDGRPATVRHTLGQSFTATAPFREVSARIGNPAGFLGVADLQGAGPPMPEPNHGSLALYTEYGGKLLAEAPFSVGPNATQEVAVRAADALPPGRYYLEVRDDDSGNRYFGPGVTWATELESGYVGGDAYSGPFHGDTAGVMRVLFDYMREHMGAAQADLTWYQDDPEYNVPDQKSGRHKRSTANSFWEGAGNGHDSYQSLWYPAACSAMAEVSDWLGDSAGAGRLRELRKRADRAFNDYYWYTVTENGRAVSRYFANRDWDGVVHDFGYTYNNLEAATRGIAGIERAREILWWLDRGQYSPDGGKTWCDDLYGMWEMAPPYSTIDNQVYLPLSGTLPYKQVVSNGGTRPTVAARDLAVRARYLSVDNMHERNLRMLGRYASPDRLTGGRTYAHWIGRWQFLGPPDDLLDMEGYREIFPQEGNMASLQPAFYFGFEPSARGLVLRPQVPGSLEAVAFGGIAYGGVVLELRAAAERAEVRLMDLAEEAPGVYVFRATDAFNHVVARLTAPEAGVKGVRVRLSLEGVASDGTAAVVGEQWLSHAVDGQEVRVTVGCRLPGSARYRLRLTETDAGVTIARTGGAPGVGAIAERTLLTIAAGYGIEGKRLVLEGEDGRRLGEGAVVKAVVKAGAEVVVRVEGR